MDIPVISCPSCNANVESANHVFFECDIATDMWKLVFRWCDIPLFQASSWDSFNDWIISWHASKEKKHRYVSETPAHDAFSQQRNAACHLARIFGCKLKLRRNLAYLAAITDLQPQTHCSYL
ncbi:hypothetical protein Tco_1377793 [Tanacetum coccineum]